MEIELEAILEKEKAGLNASLVCSRCQNFFSLVDCIGMPCSHHHGNLIDLSPIKYGLRVFDCCFAQRMDDFSMVLGCTACTHTSEKEQHGKTYLVPILASVLEPRVQADITGKRHSNMVGKVDTLEELNRLCYTYKRVATEAEWCKVVKGYMEEYESMSTESIGRESDDDDYVAITQKKFNSRNRNLRKPLKTETSLTKTSRYVFLSSSLHAEKSAAQFNYIRLMSLFTGSDKEHVRKLLLNAHMKKAKHDDFAHIADIIKNSAV